MTDHAFGYWFFAGLVWGSALFGLTALITDPRPTKFLGLLFMLPIAWWFSLRLEPRGRQ